MADGKSKSQGAPHSTVRAGRQTSTGGSGSTTATAWEQTLELPQRSTALQVRVAENVAPQAVLVTVESTARVTFVPSQRSVTAGLSKSQVVPQSTVRAGV